MAQGIIILLVLVCISAFFSLCEISLAASRKVKLQLLEEAGNGNAGRVLKLQENPGHFFTTVQIGVNAVAILGGIIGEQLLASSVATTLSHFFQSDSLTTISSIFSFVFVTLLFILLADLMPKRLAMVQPERVGILLVRPMQFCIWLCTPLVWAIDGLATRFLHLLGIPGRRSEDITADEILAMTDAGAQSGGVLKQEQQLISNVFELDTRIVPSAMTTRDCIVYIALNEKEEEIREKIAATPHDKFPVCKDGIDSVIGYVSVKDLISRMVNNQPLSLRNEPTVRKLLLIPDSLTLFEALEQFRDAREDFALVINEYALVVGLLTLQDVMNTVMGDLVSPFQEELIVRRDDGSWLIDGSTPIEDVMQALQINEFEGFENYETIAGFLMYRLRKVPKQTDSVEYHGYKFEVVDIDNHRIDQILVTLAAPSSPPLE